MPSKRCSRHVALTVSVSTGSSKAEAVGGQTRTGLLFVREMVRDLGLVRDGTHSRLDDFGEDESEHRTRFSIPWAAPSTSRLVVLVDNFQLVREDILARLTTRLVDESSSLSERLLLFLARQPDAWNSEPGERTSSWSPRRKPPSITFRSTAPRRSRWRDPSRRFDEAGLAHWSRKPHTGPVASAPQLHLAQVIQNRAALPVRSQRFSAFSRSRSRLLRARPRTRPRLDRLRGFSR